MKNKYSLVAILVVTLIIFINSYLEIQYNMNIFDYFINETWLTDEEMNYLKEHGDLIYGADKNSPPLRYLNSASGQYEGLTIDYLNVLSLELGINIKMNPMIWHEALDALENGDTDICDMYKSRERSKRFIFTDPIYYQRGVILLKRSNDKIKLSKDVEGKRVAGIKGDYVFEYIDYTYKNVEKFETEDLRSSISLLEENKVDAVFGDESVINYYLMQEGLIKDYLILDDYLYEREAVIGVSKDSDMLVDILNKAIYKLNKKKTMERIYDKWFYTSPLITKDTKIEKYTLIVKYALIIVFIVVFFFSFWNRELQKEVKKQTNALYLSKNELETTFNGLTSHLMIVVDEDCNLKDANKAFCDFVGLSLEKVKVSHCKNIKGILGSDCDKCMIKESFLTKNTIEDEIQYNKRIFKVRTYNLDSIPSTKERVLIMMEDITELKLSERKMLQSSKMAAIGQLAAGIAHEIRTPLGIIRNYTYILKRIKDESERLESIEIVEESVDRANKIIDNLLNFSRLSDNETHNINLYRFILNLYELNNKTLQENKIDFIISIEKDIEVELYSESLKHILLNLFSNSNDAMKGGGTLLVKGYYEDEKVIIEVSDTGCGMDENTLKQLFNPFYTTKEVGSGTGLGLYIVYNEVQKMNATIKVESSLRSGTVFTIVLPIKMD